MIRYLRTHWYRFLKYATLGIAAFGVDLMLLSLQGAYGLPYWVAVPTAFLIATSAHYSLARGFVFPDSHRPVGVGYLYFLCIMIGNALLITVVVTLLIEVGHVPLLAARTIVAALVGFLSFFLNSRYNFKIL